jgi:hypothetical protein
VFGEYWPFIGGLALGVQRIFDPSSVTWLLVFEEHWPFIRGLALLVNKKFEKASNQGIP